VERFAPRAALIGADDQTTSIDSADVDEGPLIEMRILELLITRLCHELSGPVAAINNGIELLDEDLEAGTPPGPGFVRDAVALVSDSAHRARNRLQFYRFAYGFSRLGASTGPPPHELATRAFLGEKYRLRLCRQRSQDVTALAETGLQPATGRGRYIAPRRAAGG
jgi:hypothetical protein